MVEKQIDTKGVGACQEHKKFPRAVVLIIFNEFCERYAYSGMRAFLALYLKQKLLYSDDEATEIYHTFSTFAYFFPIFGAILADSYFGKFRTILYMMVVYAAGNTIIAVTAIPYLGIPGRTFTLLGLGLVALGTGGIKPCVSALGGDQFKLPEQEKQLTAFFSIMYFIICMGSLISKSTSPLLRSEIHCFGDKDCYSIAFGAPGIFIISSIVLFAYYKKLFVINIPSRNIVLDVIKCMAKAVKNRRLIKHGKKNSHWLDYAIGSYEQSFIEDIKIVLLLFTLFIPLAVFWSLLDQLGSRWTFQATKMDGDFWIYTVKPDQIQVICPITILILIPFFRTVVYPLLGKFGILSKLLHRLIAGCVLAAVAFICSGCLEIYLEKTYPVLPSAGLGQLRVFNGYNNCTLILNNTLIQEEIIIEPLGYYENKFINVLGKHEAIYNKTLQCGQYTTNSVDRITIEENKAYSYFYRDSSSSMEGKALRYEDHNAKSRSGLPYVRILSNIFNDTDLKISLYNINKKNVELETSSTKTGLIDMFASEYQLLVNSQLVPININLKIGGVYTILIDGSNLNGFRAKLITITESNCISMVWILPQILIISTAEVLFAITGLEYAYKESPESMKSVMQAYWYLVEAVGNIIIILVTRLGAGYTQVIQFFFFACLMCLATVIFYILTRWYERTREKMLQNNAQRTKLQEIINQSNVYTEVSQNDNT